MSGFNELEISLIQLESSVNEMESYPIPTFFYIAGVLAVLESFLIELDSSLIQLQSAANELVRSLIISQHNGNCKMIPF